MKLFSAANILTFLVLTSMSLSGCLIMAVSPLDVPDTGDNETILDGLTLTYQLSIVQAPTGKHLAGQLLNQSFKLQLTDSKGRPISNTLISLAAYADSLCTLDPVGTLSGTSATTDADGIAEFTEVSLNYPESIYVKATVADLSMCLDTSIHLVAPQVSFASTLSVLHTCVALDGRALCWGRNSDGELGDGTTTQRSTAGLVSGLSEGVTQVAVGSEFSCALVSGAMKCWGDDSQAQLGNGPIVVNDQTTPTLVSGLSSGVTYIAAKEYHACAVQNGATLCWGLDNSFGTDAVPASVAGMDSDVTQVVIGGAYPPEIFVCGIKAGTVYCWGDNSAGYLGDGTMAGSGPVQVATITDHVQSISAGYQHVCALTTQGEVYCWGENDYGRLGTGDTTDRLTPTLVTGLGGPASLVTAGYQHTCALVDEVARCWGRNAKGELGDGSTVNQFTPVNVVGILGKSTGVYAGKHRTCTVTGGTLYCWGSGAQGALGTGSTTDVSVPTPVLGITLTNE